jgi:flagellar basal body-associated protein FliL
MPEEPEETNAEAAPAEPTSSGGFTAWLPLLLSILLMPAIAYVITTFVLIPRVQKTLATSATGTAASTTDKRNASTAVKVHAREAPQGKPKTKVQVSKIVVNVAGSQGARLLLTSLTVAGSAADFRLRIEDSMDQLRDIAATILGSKPISELEKPEARNLIRTELLSQFNAALGSGYIQEIYITEFAIQ